MGSESTSVGPKLTSEHFFNSYKPQEFNVPLQPGNFGEVYLFGKIKHKRGPK